MRNWIIIFIVIFVGAAGYGIWKVAPKVASTINQIDRGITLAERMINIVDLNNQQLLDSLKSRDKALQLQIIEMNKELELIRKENTKMAELVEKSITATNQLAEMIPSIDQADPQDYDDCLRLLNETRLIADGWKEVAERRLDEIEKLTTINANQLIMQEKLITINIEQGQHIRELHTAFDAASAKGMRAGAIGGGVGILALIISLLTK